MVTVTNLLDQKLFIGWSEWCSLPDLNLPAIKAKIDTGAKTSALHAFQIEAFTVEQMTWARFLIHPLQGDNTTMVACEAPVIDRRAIMSSNGHKEHRYVILTRLQLGNGEWDIELTLSNRDPLQFRLLLGREALNGHVIIDPSHQYQQGKIKKSALHKYYPNSGS